MITMMRRERSQVAQKALCQLEWRRGQDRKRFFRNLFVFLHLTDKNSGTISPSHLNTCAEIIDLQNGSGKNEYRPKRGQSIGKIPPIYQRDRSGRRIGYCTLRPTSLVYRTYHSSIPAIPALSFHPPICLNYQSTSALQSSLAFLKYNKKFVSSSSAAVAG